MADKERLLVHSNSDESLFDDLKHVVSAPRQLLSHLVGSRTKEDREELKRILTHLPVIRECRSSRAAGVKMRISGEAGETIEALAASDPSSAPKEPTPPGTGVTPRSPVSPATPRPRPASTGAQVPATAGSRGPAPRIITPLSARLGTTPRPSSVPVGGTTPRAAGTPRRPSPPVESLHPPMLAPKPVSANSQGPGRAPGSCGNTPRQMGMTVVGYTPPEASWPPQPSSPTPQVASSTMLKDEPLRPSSDGERMSVTMRKALELRGDKQAVRKPEDEKKSQAEATQRVIEKLAELGIDPEGMSATDILRIFYARGSGSSYWLANREAEKRLNIRASTPRSFHSVLKPRAEKEIRRARDLPVTNVHEYLDQWEIAFLGDICRSLRCFDEAAEGNNSEYMTRYTKRQYGAHSGRKKFSRSPT